MFSSFNNNMFEFSEAVSDSSPFANMFDRDPEEKEKQRLKGRRVQTEVYDTPVTKLSASVQLRQSGCDRDRPVYSHTANHVRSTLKTFCDSKNPYTDPSSLSSTGGKLTVDGPVPSSRMRRLLKRVTGAELVRADASSTVLQGGCTNKMQESLLDCKQTEGELVVSGTAAGADNYVEYIVDESQPFGSRHSLVEPVLCCDPASFDQTGNKRCLNRDFMDVRQEVLSHQKDAATLKSAVRLGHRGDPEYVFTNVDDPQTVAERLQISAKYTPAARDTLDNFVAGNCGTYRQDVHACAGDALVVASRRKSTIRTVTSTCLTLLVCVILAIALFFVFRQILVPGSGSSSGSGSALGETAASAAPTVAAVPSPPALAEARQFSEAAPLPEPPRSKMSAHTTGSIVQSLRKRIDRLLQQDV